MTADTDAGSGAPISIHLVVADAERAAAWYRDVLGATERERIPKPDGTPLTIELAIGATSVALAGEMPDAGLVAATAHEGSACAYVVPTDAADSMWDRALAAGATVFHPLADTFWGERFGQFVDPFGHRWGVAQHLRDVPHDDKVKAVAAMLTNES